MMPKPGAFARRLGRWQAGLEKPPCVVITDRVAPGRPYDLPPPQHPGERRDHRLFGLGNQLPGIQGHGRPGYALERTERLAAVLRKSLSQKPSHCLGGGRGIVALDRSRATTGFSFPHRGSLGPSWAGPGMQICAGLVTMQVVEEQQAGGSSHFSSRKRRTPSPSPRGDCCGPRRVPEEAAVVPPITADPMP